jgi:hypothetical protein
MAFIVEKLSCLPAFPIEVESRSKVWEIVPLVGERIPTVADVYPVLS